MLQPGSKAAICRKSPQPSQTHRIAQGSELAYNSGALLACFHVLPHVVIFGYFSSFLYLCHKVCEQMGHAPISFVVHVPRSGQG